EVQRALLEDALVFYQEVLERADDPDPAIRLDVARACRQVGAIQYDLGRLSQASENLRRCIELVEGLPEEHREREAARTCLVDCCTRLGSLALGAGNPKEAERWQQRALAVREQCT